jgi:hypothetical protein
MTPSERARHAANVRHGNENPFAQRLKQIQQRGKKGKAGGKGKAPKAPKPDKAAEQAAQRAANMAAVTDALMEKDAPIGKAGLDALAAFAAGGDLDEGMVQELAKLGVVRLGEDGVPRMTPDGKRLVRAAEKGDVRAALDAAFDAGEKMGIGAAGEKLPSKAKEEAAAAEAEATDPKEEEKKKGGGGGGGGSAKPSEDEKATAKAEEKAQRARDTAETVGLAPDDADALRAAAEGAGEGTDALRELGLVGDDGLTTDQGRRALAALERGDKRGYQAALQDVRAKQARDKATQEKAAAREAARAKAAEKAAQAKAKAERDEASALLDDWEAGRAGLSYKDMRRAVRLGLGKYDDAGNFRRAKPKGQA